MCIHSTQKPRTLPVNNGFRHKKGTFLFQNQVFISKPGLYFSEHLFMDIKVPKALINNMGVLRLGLSCVAVLALLVNIIGVTSRAGAPSETRREPGALLTGLLAVENFADTDALCARIGHKRWARTSAWRAANRSSGTSWGVRYRRRQRFSKTSGKEEWVSMSRAEFATEDEATAAITALWTQEEKYKEDAMQLAVLEARSCTATSEDHDDCDEQRPTTVSI